MQIQKGSLENCYFKLLLRFDSLLICFTVCCSSTPSENVHTYHGSDLVPEHVQSLVQPLGVLHAGAVGGLRRADRAVPAGSSLISLTL